MPDKLRPPCDHHPDRPATWEIGNDSPVSDYVEFRVARRLCDECHEELRKRQVLIERT